MPDNPQAYPCLDSSGDGLSMRDPGMTLRDWFAGQALVGYLAGTAFPTLPAEVRARAAYAVADAMLAERQEETPMFDNFRWPLGTRVTKTKGSQWTGKVVGFYSTNLTAEGYAVESETERGSVQIYPVAALKEARDER